MYKNISVQRTNAIYNIEIMEDSDNSMDEFVYFGIEHGFRYNINVNLHHNYELMLQFNVDGMKSYKSNNRKL